MKTDEVGLDDKIKSVARALGKKFDDPDKDMCAWGGKSKRKVVYRLMVIIQSSVLTAVSTIFIATIVIFLTVTISAFAQTKSMNESINNSGILANQTTQNMTQSANQTDEQVQQDANQTNEVT